VYPPPPPPPDPSLDTLSSPDTLSPQPSSPYAAALVHPGVPERQPQQSCLSETLHPQSQSKAQVVPATVAMSHDAGPRRTAARESPDLDRYLRRLSQDPPLWPVRQNSRLTPPQPQAPFLVDGLPADQCQPLRPSSAAATVHPRHRRHSSLLAVAPAAGLGYTWSTQTQHALPPGPRPRVGHWGRER